MIIGRVYKLTNPNCAICYIGSTYCKYASIRMAHHRQSHRRGEKDYKGLFFEGDPTMEILEEVELESSDEAWKLRKCEESWSKITDNTINQRRCYLTTEEKKENHNNSVSEYHSSPLGKVAIRKSILNTKLKRLKSASCVDKSYIKHIEKEIIFLTEQQVSLKTLLYPTL